MGESLWNTYGTFPKLGEEKTNLPFSRNEEASAVHASFATAWNPIMKNAPCAFCNAYTQRHLGWVGISHLGTVIVTRMEGINFQNDQKATAGPVTLNSSATCLDCILPHLYVALDKKKNAMKYFIIVACRITKHHKYKWPLRYQCCRTVTIQCITSFSSKWGSWVDKSTYQTIRSTSWKTK